jgi:hypothetical protein
MLTRLRRGYLREVGTILSGVGVNKIVSSLVFHQVPLAEKRAGLKAMSTDTNCALRLLALQSAVPLDSSHVTTESRVPINSGCFWTENA